MVIVTQNQFIVASKIFHITMDEQVQHREIMIGNKYQSVLDSYWTIVVIYQPEVHGYSQNSNQNFGSDTRECTVNVRGAVDAHKCFRDLIEQIREQNPDQLFLDKALQKMIEGVDLGALEIKDRDAKATNGLILEKKDDTKSKKVRRAGKTKGTGKAVLRKLKKSR